VQDVPALTAVASNTAAVSTETAAVIADSGNSDGLQAMMAGQADAAQLRDRSEGSPEAGESKVEFVEEDVVQVEDELAVTSQPAEGVAPASEAPAATADAPKAQESGKKGGKGGKGGVTLR
jgi:hypothetical protein